MRGEAARRRAGRDAALRTFATAVLMLGAVVLGSSPARADAPAPEAHETVLTVDQIVAALRKDPVLVQQVLGNGDAAGARERIRASVADSAHPVYVVLVTDPGGLADKFPARDLARKLYNRLGDGYYVVQVTRSILEVEGWGVPEPVRASLATSEAVDAARLANDHFETGRARVTPVAQAQIAAEIAAGGEPFAMEPERAIEIANLPGNLAVAPYSILDEDDPEPTTPGKRAVVATVVGVGVLLVGLRLLLWLTAPRRRGPTRGAAGWTPTDLDLSDLVSRAEEEVTRLSRDLAEAPTGSLTDTAVGYKEAADAVLRALDSQAEPRDHRYGAQLRDAVGALVLARAGRDVLERGDHRPCFADPLHGRATGRVEIPGRRAVAVPLCARCAASVKGGTAPDALVFAHPARRRPRPYYEERTLWARSGYGALDDTWWSTVLAARAGTKR